MVALALAGAAIAASAAGGYMQYQSSKAQSAAQQQQIAAEQRAEQLRKRAMELDAHRRTMEMVRQQQRTRAAALAVGTAQGSSQGSGLQGAYGQIAGQSGFNMLGVSQNLQLGQQMFAANQDLSAARMSYAQAGEYGSLGRGISGIGATITANLDPLSRIAGGFGTGRPTPISSSTSWSA